MIAHNIKFAFRNLLKYRTQNIISIIGLAVGFACFAFSALWIRYEMSYDGFHSKAGRIYRVNVKYHKWDAGETGAKDAIQNQSPYPLANRLTDFPEIEEACAIQTGRADNRFGFLYLDHHFCKIFDLNLPENLFIRGHTDRPVAVIPALNNEETAKFIKEQFNYDVQTVIPHWPANTNIQFTLAVPLTLRYTEERLNNWGLGNANYDIYVLIHNGVDIKTLEKKLDKVEISEMQDTPLSLVLTPLKQLRYKDPTGNIHSDIKFSHIRIFAMAGLLVILCSLFNHLTLYVTRMRMRLRELALRKVNGATDRQIAATLYTDFLLVILLSLVVGFILIGRLLPAFKEYATIQNSNVSIYTELALYVALLITCGFIAGSIPILYFRRQVLNDIIKGYGSRGSRNLFRKGSLLVQLIISLGMMFCAVVFIKQVRFLHQQTDLLINHRNITFVEAGCCPLPPHYADRIKQVPGIVDAIPIIEPRSLLMNLYARARWDGIDSNGNAVSYLYYELMEDARFFDFFGLEIIKGTVYPNEPAQSNNDNDAKFLLNETAMKEAGELSQNPNFMGVVRDFYITPTAKVMPLKFFYPSSYALPLFRVIAYKYEEGMRRETEDAVTQWLREEFPDQGEFNIRFTCMEDVLEENFKSEQALFILLSVMTLACILIAIFGVYSLARLTCQQRRKEIAIRKINGAEAQDIMNIFFREYLILLVLAAFVAFPAGYIIMKRWMEGYVKQTLMDAWLFVLIFLIVFVIIVFSIVSMVWKAANRNPAEVVKSE